MRKLVLIEALVEDDDIEGMTDLEIIEYVGTDQHSVILTNFEIKDLEEEE